MFERIRRGRLGISAALLVVCGLTVGMSVIGSSLIASSAVAQEAEKKGDAEAKGGDAKAPAPAGDAAPVAKKNESMLVFYLRALGWRYTIAFSIISFAGVALLVMNLLSARRDNIAPLSLVDAFETHLNEKRYQEAYELAKADDSFLGHVLASGLTKLNKGYDYAIEAMQEVGEEENMRLEHRLSYVALIAAIAPMVGLLGTVDGMVASFMVIASSDTTPKPSQLADGIATALITTLVGLVIAIPAMAIFGILKNRIAQLVLEVGILSEELMSRFSEAGKKA